MYIQFENHLSIHSFIYPSIHPFMYHLFFYPLAESNLMKQSLSKHVEQIEALNKSLLEKEEEIKRLKNEGFSQEKYDRLKYEETIASLKSMIQGMNGQMDG